MSRDAWGNYVVDPTLNLHQVAVVPGGISGNLSGSGSPEGVTTASPGTGYVNTATGDFYVKQTGTGNTGWVLVTGGIGASNQFFITGDPNGAQTATRPAIAYDNGGRFWEKTGAGSNNTGWEQLIGPPL